MNEGKLPAETLDALLAGLPLDGRVRLGPGTGRDAAVVALADRYLVLAADPVSFTSARIGWYAVHVNANDVACLGGEPRWFLATVLLPLGVEADAVATIFADLRAACAEVGATLVGGHTEISAAVSQAVIGGAIIGEAPLDRLFPSDASEPGDALLQVGPVAIEGTALLAHEAADRLRGAGLSAAEISAAAALLVEPGITVLPAARTVWELPGVHSLHDPTEGGIATGCLEVAEAAGVGITLFAEQIVSHSLTTRVAAALGVDWLGLLASGSLLVTMAPDCVDRALQKLHNAGHRAAMIGRIGARGDAAILQAGGEPRPLLRFPRDEVVRVLGRDS